MSFDLIWLEHLFCLQQSPDSSFTGAGAAVEEELQELKKKLSEEEARSRELEERLLASEQLLQEKEAAHAEQVMQNICGCRPLKLLLVLSLNGFLYFQLQKLQAVVCEKDVRFQEQIQKHEEELLKATMQSQDEGKLQKVKDCQFISLA